MLSQILKSCWRWLCQLLQEKVQTFNSKDFNNKQDRNSKHTKVGVKQVGYDIIAKKMCMAHILIAYLTVEGTIIEST